MKWLWGRMVENEVSNGFFSCLIKNTVQYVSFTFVRRCDCVFMEEKNR